MSSVPPPIQNPKWDGPVQEEFDRRWIYIVGGGFLILLVVLLILLFFLTRPDGQDSIAGNEKDSAKQSGGSRPTSQPSNSDTQKSTQPPTNQAKAAEKKPASPQSKKKDEKTKSNKETNNPSTKAGKSKDAENNYPGASPDSSTSPKKQDDKGLNVSPTASGNPSTSVTQTLPNQIPISGITSQPVEFFGIKADAGRIVFVIDKSSSMAGQKRFIRAVAELTKSINSLNQDQSFAVVWFDTLAYPQSKTLQKASDSNKQNEIQSFRKTRPSGGTNPTPAVQAALDMKTEAIFLLSDGEVDANCVARISQANKDKVPIHTVSFSRNVVFLKKIATDSGGFFRVAD